MFSLKDKSQDQVCQGVADYLDELAAKGVAVIMVSSELPEVLGMSDRIMVMKDGRIVEIGDTEELFQNPKEEYTRQLLSES